MTNATSVSEKGPQRKNPIVMQNTDLECNIDKVKLWKKVGLFSTTNFTFTTVFV